MRATLRVEALEDRTLAAASASVALVNGVLSVQADDGGDFFTVSQKSVGGVAIVELFRAETNSVADFNANQVSSIKFTGGAGNDTFYQTTNLPSVLQAGGGASTYKLVATAGQNALIGSTNPLSKNYLQASGNGQTFVGTAGLVNVFGAGADTITVSGASVVQLYDIVGASKVSVSAASGYALVNATSSVTVSPGVKQVTFFAASANPTAPAVVQNGVLWLQDQDATRNSFVVTTGRVPGQADLVVVQYANGQGQVRYVTAPLASVSWVAYFSPTGVSYVDVEAPLNTALYAKSGSTLIGSSLINVEKIHSGSGLAIGRGVLNDLFAGPAGTTPGATLLSIGGQAIFRNDTSRITTRDLGARPGDILVGVPAQINNATEPDAGQASANIDFAALFLYEKALGLL